MRRKAWLLAAALLAASPSSAACDAFVLTGLALHGDRDHHYRTLTTGAGCEWIWPDWRAGAVGFLNSNTERTLLVGGAYMPFHRDRWSAGVALGDAMLGYERAHQLAGGLTLEWLGKHVGGDVIYIPRVDGMKGSVTWLRAKLLGGWEPLK